MPAGFIRGGNTSESSACENRGTRDPIEMKRFIQARVTYTVPLQDVVRAITDSEEEGFVKIHVREGTDRILGAAIVGRTAGELINTISLAMVAGLGLRRLAQVIHAYPTLGEAVRQTAQACALSLAPPVLMRKRKTT